MNTLDLKVREGAFERWNTFSKIVANWLSLYMPNFENVVYDVLESIFKNYVVKTLEEGDLYEIVPRVNRFVYLLFELLKNKFPIELFFEKYKEYTSKRGFKVKFIYHGFNEFGKTPKIDVELYYKNVQLQQFNVSDPDEEADLHIHCVKNDKSYSLYTQTKVFDGSVTQIFHGSFKVSITISKHGICIHRISTLYETPYWNYYLDLVEIHDNLSIEKGREIKLLKRIEINELLKNILIKQLHWIVYNKIINFLDTVVEDIEEKTLNIVNEVYNEITQLLDKEKIKYTITFDREKVKEVHKRFEGSTYSI